MSASVGSHLISLLSLAVSGVAMFAFPMTTLHAQSSVGALTSGPMSGTYRLLLCASTCTEADSSNALAVAAIVIADDSLANTDAWKTTLAEIRGRRVMRQASAMDNVCFRIERRRSHVGSEELYFGIDRNGSTRLGRRDGDSLSIRVYQSPDASYVLRWQGTGERITGEGWSSGWRVTQTPHRNAYFIATRTGPPVADACR